MHQFRRRPTGFSTGRGVLKPLQATVVNSFISTATFVALTRVFLTLSEPVMICFTKSRSGLKFWSCLRQINCQESESGFVFRCRWLNGWVIHSPVQKYRTSAYLSQLLRFLKDYRKLTAWQRLKLRWCPHHAGRCTLN